MVDFGLRIKNHRGELVTDGISDMGQVFAIGSAALNAYQYASFNFSAWTNTVNVDGAWSIDQYASPIWRCYDKGLGYAFNRFWYNTSAIFKIAALQVGTGVDISLTPGRMGFLVTGKKGSNLLNADYRSLRWCSTGLINASWSTITGTHDGWIWGPFTIDFSSVELKRAPFTIISPMTYVDISKPDHRLRAATIFKVSKTQMLIGDYLTQTAGYGYTGGNKVFEVALFTLD